MLVYWALLSLNHPLPFSFNTHLSKCPWKKKTLISYSDNFDQAYSSRDALQRRERGWWKKTFSPERLSLSVTEPKVWMDCLATKKALKILSILKHIKVTLLYYIIPFSTCEVGTLTRAGWWKLGCDSSLQMCVYSSMRNPGGRRAGQLCLALPIEIQNTSRFWHWHESLRGLCAPPANTVFWSVAR